MLVWNYYKRFYESGRLTGWSFDGWESEHNTVSGDPKRLYGEHYRTDEVFDCARGLYDLNTGEYLTWIWIQSDATAANVKRLWPW